jgi:uncharacterized membrane protein HdeD (DUF308 family)
MGIYDREEVVERANRRAKIGSAVLIASGALPIFLPLLAGLSVSLALGLTLVAAALAYGILAFSVRERSARHWLTLVSATFLVVPLTPLARQDIPVATLALAIAASFFIEAAAEIAYFVIVRPRSGSRWALANTFLTISAAFSICSGCVRSLTWVLEIVVGVALIVSGLSWIPRSRAYSSYNLR